MKGLWRSLILVLVLPLFACQGELPASENPTPGGTTTDDDPYAPCTDLQKCCPQDQIVCKGDPDKGVTCTCSSLWDCTKNPNKCDSALPTPDGSSGWNCTWSEFKYTCEKKGDTGAGGSGAGGSGSGGSGAGGSGSGGSGAGGSGSGAGGSGSGAGGSGSGAGGSGSGETGGSGAGAADKNPGGSNGWDCSWSEKEFKWECTKSTIPNPTNQPSGTSAWKCKVDSENSKLICERENDTTNMTPPDNGGGVWEKGTGSNGGSGGSGDNGNGTTWEKKDDNNGLPPGGANWKCHMVTRNGKKIWVCYGEGNGSTPPGGNGWTCNKVKNEFGKDIYKCERAEKKGDVPPGGGWYSCVKGSEFGGTKCEKVPTNPQPPTPDEGGVCKIGEKLWCDGLTYCGWGQVICDKATNTWQMKTVNGKKILDCQESMAGGKVPNTICACYHFFYNPACCERSDCIVPDGASGQVCPESKGKLCDYCNPLKSECKESGAKCIVTNAHETFCGRDCSSTACPSGFMCMNVTITNNNSKQVVKQCVPTDYSCYY